MSSKPNISGLERLSVPTWDGNQKSYATWKREFNHWMAKYSQDKDEQLQRFRKAMPKGFWWTDQVKTCKTIGKAWDILDIVFADKRKLMDELLTEISGRRPIKKDSKSLAQYATTITGYVNDMEDNGCSVLEASKAPFFMSQLLSKLDPRDNMDFGREMKRETKDENATNLLNGYIKKQVSDPEANKSPKGSSENGSIEKLTQGDQTTMQPTVGQLMTKHVPLAAHQNICLLHVPPTKAQQWIKDGKLSSKTKDAANVWELHTTQMIAESQMVPPATNARKIITVLYTTKRRILWVPIWAQIVLCRSLDKRMQSQFPREC